MTVPDAAILKQAVEDFFQSIADVAPARIAALFAEDGEIEDPVGSEVCRGRANVETYFTRGLASLVTRARVETVALFPAGDRIAAHWTMHAWGTSGREADAAGIDVLYVDAAGKIQRVEGYWDAAAFVGAIKPA